MQHHVLAESHHYVLAHEYESVVVVCRHDGRRTVMADHAGDPSCGLIAPDESWFAAGGEGVTLFTFSKGTAVYLRDEGYAIFAMRLDQGGKIRILVDPWSDEASVWQLDPLTGALLKLRDGPDLSDGAFRGHIAY